MELDKYIKAIKDYILKSYKDNFREPIADIKYPFLVPGADYAHQLWDWDSWLTGYALMDIDDKDVEIYQKGCILNFLDHMDKIGRMPIVVQDGPCDWLHPLDEDYHSNVHKPCLAIHALEICQKYGDFEWIRGDIAQLMRFIEYYEKYQKDEESGLFYWLDDFAIGFDNDPSVFYHQDCSSAAIYLNSLMYEEIKSVLEILKGLGMFENAEKYQKKLDDLGNAIRSECFDNVDGFFYSADVSLRKVDSNEWLHSGHQRFWHTLPIKITTWAGMLPLWNGLATKEEAEACVKHYLNPEGLYSKFGIRSVAKNEKMYGIFATGNPSCWLGPIWINANYFTYVGLLNYGYKDLAREIAEKTITLLGQDILENGQFHEYYDPENGKGVRGLGFQSWNFLVLKMINDINNNRI